MRGAGAEDAAVAEWPPLELEVLEKGEDEDDGRQPFMADQEEPLTERFLSQPPADLNAPWWLDSDDAPACEDGRSVRMLGLSKSRQTILSRLWVHESHTPPVREWTVRASEASFDFGDIYWGYSEAQSFQRNGWTCLFDVRGNLRFGDHPLSLVNCERRPVVQLMEHTAFSGAFNGDKGDRLVIRLDLGKQMMVIRNARTGDTLQQQFMKQPVRCARLCVSLRTAGDAVEIEAVR